MKKRYVSFCILILLHIPLLAQYTQVPDPNFEQALIDEGYDDIIDGQFLTSNAQGVLELFLDNKNINDVTGIEAFTNLLSLHLYNNNLPSIDLSLLPINLHSLFLGSNNLTTIDLSPIPNIVNLFLNTNNLTAIDASDLIHMFGLSVSDNNNLSTLLLENCTNLQSLGFSSTSLMSLDTSTCPSLKWVNCFDSLIENLDFTYNQNLEELICYNTQLTSINLPNNPDLNRILTSNTLLTELDVTNCPALELLSCAAIGLTSLDLTQNPLLDDLFCQENELTALDISQNPLLTRVVCDDNLINTIDLSNNLFLDNINISRNPLTEIINPQGAENLSELIAAETNLVELDLSLNPNLNIASFFTSPNLQFVNMNNGFNETLSLFVGTQCPQLSCVVVDDPLAINDNFLIDANTTLVASVEDCVLATNDTNLQDNITLYPNPVKDNLSIDSTDKVVINTLKIYNLLGEQVLQINNPSNKVNVSNVPSGVFFVQITTNEGVISKKIIKE